MKIAVIGVGGVGGYFGGCLARAGVEVTFVARARQCEALRQRGLEIQSTDGTFTVSHPRVVDSPARLIAPEVVLLATKAYDLESVSEQLAGVSSRDTVIISLQNGIDNDLRIKRLILRAQVHPGVVYVISTKAAPTLIRQTAGPRTILFGDRQGRYNSALTKLESLLRQAGIQATASTDIVKEIWSKFLWITTFAGMTALCRSPIGPIVNDAEAFELYEKCLDEGLTVAAAEGVGLDTSTRANILEKSKAYRETGFNAKSSLLVDIENGRQTEIESLNGTLVRLARKHGVRVPIHEIITKAISLAMAAQANRKSEQ